MRAQPPDLVIPGAAKAGTTALYTYLARHPAVFAPELKEPGYFSTDIPGGLDAGAYAALFAAAPMDALRVEASTRYLYSEVALPRLLAQNPQAKVLVMLRHPVAAARSLHAYAYRYGREDLPDFEQAWRALGRRLASSPQSVPPDYNYQRVHRYAQQLPRLLASVPAPQRHVLLFEEFFADPAGHLQAIQRFLGLAPQRLEAFPPVNAAEQVRSARLEALLRKPPPALGPLYALGPLLHALGLRPLRMLRRLNWRAGQAPELRPAFRTELEEFFAADVRAVEELLGLRWPALERG